jgi:hypothetical protein
MISIRRSVSRSDSSLLHVVDRNSAASVLRYAPDLPPWSSPGASPVLGSGNVLYGCRLWEYGVEGGIRGATDFVVVFVVV